MDPVPKNVPFIRHRSLVTSILHKTGKGKAERTCQQEGFSKAGNEGLTAELFSLVHTPSTSGPNQLWHIRMKQAAGCGSGG